MTRLSQIAAQKLGQFLTEPTDPRRTPDERPDPEPIPADSIPRTLSGEYISSYAEQLDHELEKQKPPEPGVINLSTQPVSVQILDAQGQVLATAPIQGMNTRMSHGGRRVEIQMDLTLYTS